MSHPSVQINPATVLLFTTWGIIFYVSGDGTHSRPTPQTEYNPMQVTYGIHQFDFTKLPAQTLEAMLKRGVTHFLGNEQASKVSGWTKKFSTDNDGALPGDDEVAAKKAEYVAEAIAKMEAGTVGTASRGPSADPIEAEMDRIAKREINLVLKENNAKFSGKGDDRKVTFADGTSYTMDELIERRLGNADHSARIRKEAEKALRAAAKAAESAKGKVASIDAIG